MWKDVNFSDGVLTIRRAVNIRKRKLKDTTKTSSSKRTLKLDPETINLLVALRNRQGKSNVAALRRGETLVFTAQDGRPVKDSSVRKTLNLALKKAGLAHIRIHDLRHTAGSLLLDAGYSFPVVAAFLGLNSPATTAAVYAHAVRKGASVAEVLNMSAQKSAQNEKKPVKSRISAGGALFNPCRAHHLFFGEALRIKNPPGSPAVAKSFHNPHSDSDMPASRATGKFRNTPARGRAF